VKNEYVEWGALPTGAVHGSEPNKQNPLMQENERRLEQQHPGELFAIVSF
jgi:hypothetical protein